MTHAENEVLINRTPGEVHDFLADGLNNSLWRSRVTDIALASGTAGTVGAVYRQKMAGPGGRSIDGDYMITAAVPGSRLDFEVVAGPARPSGSYILTPVDGGTKVRFSPTLEPKGLMKLAGPMITKTMRGEVAQLDNLKRVLEQDR